MSIPNPKVFQAASIASSLNKSLHLLSTLSFYFRFLSHKIFGDRITNAIKRFLCYTFSNRSPFLLLVYICVTYGGIAVFLFRGVIPYLPSENLGLCHIIFCCLLITSSFASFIVFSMSDPGMIKKEAIKDLKKKYPYDGILFKEKECTICKMPKIARSEHCLICNVCIEKHDHHCALLHRCIGAKNYRYFLLFLLTHAMMCIDITYMTFITSIIIITEGKIAFIKLSAHMSLRGFIGVWTTILGDFVERYPDLIVILLISTLMGLLTVALLIMNTVIVLTNRTTNESDIAYGIERQLTRARDNLKAKVKAEDDVEEKTKKIEGQLKELTKNYYNKGIKKNIKEVLFPN